MELRQVSLDSINVRANRELKGLKGKDFKDFYKNRLSFVKDQIEGDQFLFDSYYYPFVKSIYEEIKQSNHQVEKHPIDILVGRSPVPNAYCYGNGVLVVNMGLISRLQNQDQLAFVICHELAHQLLDHVDSKIKKQIARQNSRAYKKKVRKLSKQEYNKLDKIEEFYLEETLKKRQYSRQKELQADSFGLALLKNCNFNPNEALNVIDILDHIEESKYKDSINFNQHFSYQNFKFKSKWLKKSNGLEVEQKLDKELIDSLKTHPDCKLRIEELRNEFNLSPLTTHAVTEDFQEKNVFADLELIHYSLIQQDYGYVLSQSLLMLESYPKNQYLQRVVGICLAEIYFAQKHHKLRDYVARPDDDHEYNYQRTLLLVENIRLSELRELTLRYMNKTQKEITDEVTDSQHLIYHNFLKEKIENKIEEAQALKEVYQEKFPGGYFKSFIN